MDNDLICGLSAGTDGDGDGATGSLLDNGDAGGASRGHAAKLKCVGCPPPPPPPHHRASFYYCYDDDDYGDYYYLLHVAFRAPPVEHMRLLQKRAIRSHQSEIMSARPLQQLMRAMGLTPQDRPYCTTRIPGTDE